MTRVRRTWVEPVKPMTETSGTATHDHESAAHARVGRTLQAGLVLSAALMAAGLLLLAIQGKNRPTRVIPLDRLVGQVARGEPGALLDAGIVLLFLTPLAGILMALAEYVRCRDWQFVIVALLLLTFAGLGFVVALR